MSPSGEHDVNHDDVFQWFRMLIEQYEIYPLWVGYDRYCAAPLVQTMNQYGFHMDSVFQGENLTGIISKTEGLFKDGKIYIGNNDLMAVHILDSALKTNTENDRRKCIKISKNAHVDGMHSLLDAMCMRYAHFDEISERLKNEV